LIANTWSPRALRVRTLGSSVSGSARCPRVLTWLGWHRPPVRWRAAHQSLLAFALFIPAARSLRSRTLATSSTRMNKPTQAIPVAPRLRCIFCPVSIKSMARSVQARVAVQQAQAVRPNPSIERTAAGLAREAPQVVVPLRGPIRRPPLMSNVRPHRNRRVFCSAAGAPDFSPEVIRALEALDRSYFKP
jgi:hypothetical protein